MAAAKRRMGRQFTQALPASGRLVRWPTRLAAQPEPEVVALLGALRRQAS